MDVEEIIDRLYALPLAEFTRERNKAERKLRKAGQREQAEQMKALRKPAAAAAAVNQLVHSHRAQVETFLRTAATLRDAQVKGKGDLAAAAQAEREELEKLVRLGGETVRPTLQAAAVDDNTARELLQGRLVREPEPAGFGTLLAHAPPAGNSSTSRPRKAKQPKASGHVSRTCSQIASGSAVPKIESSTFGSGHSDAAMIGGAAAMDASSLAQPPGRHPRMVSNQGG